VGELVCTHLAKECQPLVRYRTRDIITVTGVEPGPDGRTAWRFRVTGRTDDMFNVRGINVFPGAVRIAVDSVPQWASGMFRIVLKGDGPYDRITMTVEAAQGLPVTRWSEAAERVEAAVRTTVGSTAKVTMVPFEHFPRTEGKTRWVEKEA
jgi:phenylacetate-CoA ligase